MDLDVRCDFGTQTGDEAGGGEDVEELPVD